MGPSAGFIIIIIALTIFLYCVFVCVSLMMRWKLPAISIFIQPALMPSAFATSKDVAMSGEEGLLLMGRRSCGFCQVPVQMLGTKGSVCCLLEECVILYPCCRVATLQALLVVARCKV